MVVLDSDILIDVLRGNETARQKLDALERRREKLNTTVINAFELFEGAFLSGDSRKFMPVVTLLKAFGSYHFDGHASWKAAEISADLGKKDMAIDFEDIASAAIALSRSEAIITRNVIVKPENNPDMFFWFHI